MIPKQTNYPRKRISTTIVDSDRKSLKILTMLFSMNDHFQVTGIFQYAADAWKHIKSEIPNLLVIDSYLLENNSIELWDKLLSLREKTQIIFTAYYYDNHLKLIGREFQNYLLKPLGPKDIENILLKSNNTSTSISINTSV